jgi:hypothetical protein
MFHQLKAFITGLIKTPFNFRNIITEISTLPKSHKQSAKPSTNPKTYPEFYSKINNQNTYKNSQNRGYFEP